MQDSNGLIQCAWGCSAPASTREQGQAWRDTMNGFSFFWTGYGVKSHSFIGANGSMSFYSRLKFSESSTDKLRHERLLSLWYTIRFACHHPKFDSTKYSTSSQLDLIDQVLVLQSGLNSQCSRCSYQSRHSENFRQLREFIALQNVSECLKAL